MDHLAIDADVRLPAAAQRRSSRTEAPASQSRTLSKLDRYVFAIAALAIAVGVFARLSSLERKLVFQDEAYSFVRVAGYVLADVARFNNGRTHSARELAQLQVSTPERGIDATIRSLAEEPGRAPLYYVAARLWMNVVGGALANARAFSAILGTAGIGIAFFLGRRLTGANTGGAVAAAFTALSPMLVRYSQQLREYILVADLTLLSTWLLVRALDRGSRLRWAAYGVCVAAGIYTSITFAAPVLAHGCVVALLALRRRHHRSLVAFCCAAAAGLVSYAPWLAFALPRAAGGGDTVAFASDPYSLSAFAMKWAFNIGAIFYDSEYANKRLALVVVPILLLVAIAIRHAIVTKGNPRARLMVLGLVASAIVPLVILDVLRGSHLESVVRYLMPSWAGIELLVVLLVTSMLLARRAATRAAGLIAFTYVTVCGFASVFADRPYDQWWDNNEHLSEQIVAREIRRRGPALIVAGGDRGSDHNVLVLSRYLPPNATLLLGARPARLPSGTKRAYVLLPSTDERRVLLAVQPAGAALINISPPIGLNLPDLRSRDPDLGRFTAGNALWELSVP